MHKLLVHWIGKTTVYLHTTGQLDIYSLKSIHRPDLVKKKKIPMKMKWTVWKRDGYICHYCHTTNGPFTVDHIIPECQGGAFSLSNFVTACPRCNSHKGELSYIEFKDSDWLFKRKRDILNGPKTKRNNKSSSRKSKRRKRLLGVRLQQLPGSTRGSRNKLQIPTEFE